MAQPCGWPHWNGLICLCSNRRMFKDPCLSSLNFTIPIWEIFHCECVLFFIFLCISCPALPLCPRSSSFLNLKYLPFFLPHPAPFFKNAFTQNSVLHCSLPLKASNSKQKLNKKPKQHLK